MRRQLVAFQTRVAVKGQGEAERASLDVLRFPFNVSI